MSDLNFDRLYEYFCKVPSVQKGLIDSYGSDGKQAWWFKFQINVDHPLAWQTVQEPVSYTHLTLPTILLV